MTKQPELKPCPFCGGYAIATRHDNDGFIVICCFTFGLNTIHNEAFGEYDTRLEAITAWNTRA